MKISELIELLNSLPEEEKNLEIVAFSYRSYYIKGDVGTVAVGDDLDIIVKP